MNFNNTDISIREFIDDEEYAEYQLQCAFNRGKIEGINKCIEILKSVLVFDDGRLIKLLEKLKEG